MNKIKLVIIGVVIIIIVIVFIFVSLINTRPDSTPLPQNTPPTPQALSSKELSIVSISPADKSATYLPAQPIEIVFTQPISKTAISYTATPPTETFVSMGQKPNSLIISPTTIWTTGNTTISIKNAVSDMGNTLTNPQEYILRTAIPTIPDNLEGAY